MPRRAPSPDDLPPLLAEIQRRLPEVQGIWLFGSLARGRARADSDIDLAVLARAPLDPVEVFELGLELGVIANRDVDLVDLRRVSVLLRHIVSTEGQRQLTLDADACEAFEAATAAMWCAVREEQAIARRQASGARR